MNLSTAQILAAPGGLAEHMAIAQHQNVLGIELSVPVQLLQETLDVPGGDSLGLRRGPGEGLLGLPEGQGTLLPGRGARICGR